VRGAYAAALGLRVIVLRVAVAEAARPASARRTAAAAGLGGRLARPALEGAGRLNEAAREPGGSLGLEVRAALGAQLVEGAALAREFGAA
jgi:hypothetical protein